MSSRGATTTTRSPDHSAIVRLVRFTAFAPDDDEATVHARVIATTRFLIACQANRIREIGAQPLAIAQAITDMAAQIGGEQPPMRINVTAKVQSIDTYRRARRARKG